jgi:arylsulfatase A-like enzyme
VPWEVDSDWQRQPLPADHPERSLPPPAVDDFEPGGDAGASRWFSTPRLQALTGRSETADAAVASIVTVGSGHALELPAAGTLALRVLPATSLTPCVVTLRIRGDRHVNGEPRLLVLDLSQDVSKATDDADVAKRIVDGRLVTTRRLVGFGLVPREARDANVYLVPETARAGADGFESWRFEFETRFGVRGLALVVLGSSAGPIAIDDVAVRDLPARALLGLAAPKAGAAGLQSFDLPRTWENLDRDARVTKVRLDWESRRALLLTRGAQASCVVPLPMNGVRVEFGLGIVREERLLVRGAITERARVTAVVRAHGADGSREIARHFEPDELRLAPAEPTLWQEVGFDLPALPMGAHQAELELRVSIDGTDDPLGPLIALGSPFVRVHELAPSPRLNVVLISLDTLRADRLGRVRDGASLTPNLDRLAKESLVFGQALANSSYTLPSHVSIFTSQRPGVHGVQRPDSAFSPERSPNLAQLLADRGWLTVAFTSGGMLNAEFCGIDRGFDRFGEIDAMLSPNDALRAIAPLPDRPDYNRRLGEACRIADRVVPWLASHRDAPFFLFLHTYLVHDYQPEEQFAERFTRGLKPTPLRITGPVPYVAQISEKRLLEQGHGDSRFSFSGAASAENPHEFVPARDLPLVEALYDATVAQADRDVGKLLNELDQLGLRDKTIVVVVADHGEEFLEHGDLSHARTLFDEILRVPLLIRIPGVAPRTIDAPVELIDLAPTLLARLHVGADPRMQGRDLLAPDWEEQLTIHEGVEAGAAVADARERRTLRAVRGFGAKLVLLTKVGPGPGELPLSENAMQTLIRLGYVGGGVGKGGFYDLRVDPGEQHDLAGDPSLDAKHASQLVELLRILERAPAQPEASPPETRK